jgi:hypothetical protein
MYIKTTRNAAGQEYFHLVESYWQDGRSRQRTLLSLGRAGEDKMDEVIAAISKHRDVFTILQLAKNISVDKTFILGPLLVLQRMFENSGIDEVLQRVAKQHPKLGFDLRELVFTMAAARFVRPGSKLKVYEHWQNCLYPAMLVSDIALHQLYRTLDVLHAHKDEIEKALFWRGRDLLTI